MKRKLNKVAFDGTHHMWAPISTHLVPIWRCSKISHCVLLKNNPFLHCSSPSLHSPAPSSLHRHMATQTPRLTTAVVLTLSILLLASTTSYAHNITRILAKHPAFSTFNHYLTVTHLAAEINRRQTITVLALDNAAMSSLLDKQLSVYTLRNVLSFHVLVDYFGAKKLHQITNGTTLTATMFQSTGAATGSSGYVNITDLKAGKVAFGSEENDGKLDAVYVKSLVEIPYNISVLQISQVKLTVSSFSPEFSQLKKSHSSGEIQY